MRTWRLMADGLVSLTLHKGKAMLMSLGAIVGVGVLLVIMGISAGEERVMAQRLKRVGDQAILVVAGHGRMKKAVGGQEKQLMPADAEAIRTSLPAVASVSAYALKADMSLKAGPAQSRSMITAVDAHWHQVWDWPVVAGQPLTAHDIERMSRVCLLGATVKGELFGDGPAVGRFVRIGGTRFKVKGVLESRGITGQAHDRDRRVVVPITTGMNRLFRQRHINTLRVKVRPGRDLERTAADIIALLNRRHQVNPALEEPFSAFTSGQMAGKVRGLSDTVRGLLLGLSLLALLVGGGVQTSIMLSAVSMRRSEIGLRLALGASPADIQTQFLAEALGVGLLGSAAGLALGAGLLLWLASFTALPVAFSGWSLVAAVLCALAAGVGFGVYPARRAARLDPVEALSCT